MKTSIFTYNAIEVSLDGRRFGSNIATHAGLGFDPETGITYESIDVYYEPLCEQIGMESFFATLAEYMNDWGDFKKVRNHKELFALVYNTICQYGKEIKHFVNADDFDDYIILLLEARDMFYLNELWFCENHLIDRYLMSYFNLEVED
jgi:hypothetical protein